MNNDAGSALLRRREIERIVGEGGVRSQHELRQRLRQRGFVVAQPTLSRDLKDLAVVKTRAGYALPPTAGNGSAPAAAAPESTPRADRLARALRESVLSVDRAGTIVVVRTPPAAANPLARLLDAAAIPELVGSVAGDDTIFVATRSPAAAARLARRLLDPIRPSRAGRPPRRRPVS
jgi:transcriptional regulator of arginine metabolism